MSACTRVNPSFRRAPHANKNTGKDFFPNCVVRAGHSYKHDSVIILTRCPPTKRTVFLIIVIFEWWRILLSNRVCVCVCLRTNLSSLTYIHYARACTISHVSCGHFRDDAADDGGICCCGEDIFIASRGGDTNDIGGSGVAVTAGDEDTSVAAAAAAAAVAVLSYCGTSCSACGNRHRCYCRHCRCRRRRILTSVVNVPGSFVA